MRNQLSCTCVVCMPCCFSQSCECECPGPLNNGTADDLPKDALPRHRAQTVRGVGSDLGARVQSSVNSSALEEFHSEDDFIPTILGPDMGPKQVWAGGPFSFGPFPPAGPRQANCRQPSSSTTAVARAWPEQMARRPRAASKEGAATNRAEKGQG
jgi:hypothetical protein